MRKVAQHRDGWRKESNWGAPRPSGTMNPLKNKSNNNNNTYLVNYLLTYLLTYLLHGAESFLLQLTGLQLVKKFPAFHGTRRFITAFTSVRHLSLS